MDELTNKNLETLPKEKEGMREAPDTPGIYGRYSMSAARNTSYDTSRGSYRSTIDSQQPVKRRNVKVSIAEYPKFSGKAKDWIIFERKFRSVASSRCLDHVLQDEEYEPTDPTGRQQYKEDLAFIYDAFQNAWADSMNFYLVEQNKKTKDGRKVYLDAKNYFRGAAVKDAILTENMDELINYKLTHTRCCLKGNELRGNGISGVEQSEKE